MSKHVVSSIWRKGVFAFCGLVSLMAITSIQAETGGKPQPLPRTGKDQVCTDGLPCGLHFSGGRRVRLYCKTTGRTFFGVCCEINEEPRQHIDLDTGAETWRCERMRRPLTEANRCIFHFGGKPATRVGYGGATGPMCDTTGECGVGWYWCPTEQEVRKPAGECCPLGHMCLSWVSRNDGLVCWDRRNGPPPSPPK